jgi:hypothetical protein
MNTEAGAETGAAARSISGTVKDKKGLVIVGVKVEVAGVTGGQPIFSDAQGKYTAPAPAEGMTAVKFSKDWFTPLATMVNVQPSGVTPFDATLEEMPLKVEAADRALAETHAKTFDWTKSTLSIAVVPRPTRRDFDNGVYWRNPALYRDTSKEAAVVPPAPAPVIEAGVAKNFTFPVRSGPNMGQEALELASIADAMAMEPADFMLWTPMINWLTEWDAAKAASLKAVEVALRQQNWGGMVPRPQSLEKVFLDAQGDLWVKVVFAGFLELDPSVKDDDGDGLPEVYARVGKAHYTKEIVDKLNQEYKTTLFDTHGLSKEVIKSLNELYSTTAAQVERTIGQPFEVPGLGTIMYPTLVLRHSGGQKNVLLVAPGP